MCSLRPPEGFRAVVSQSASHRLQPWGGACLFIPGLRTPAFQGFLKLEAAGPGLQAGSCIYPKVLDHFQWEKSSLFMAGDQPCGDILRIPVSPPNSKAALTPATLTLVQSESQSLMGVQCSVKLLLERAARGERVGVGCSFPARVIAFVSLGTGHTLAYSDLRSPSRHTQVCHLAFPLVVIASRGGGGTTQW